MIRAVRRAVAVASFGLPVLVAGMASCTGGAADIGPSTVPRIGATNYVTQPIVTLLPPTTVPGQTTVPGGTVVGAVEYRIRNGDTISGIASRYGITTDELVDFNGWDSSRHTIIQGQIILIPPFADLPDLTETTEETFFIGGPTCPDGTEQKTYTIEPGDFVGRVARELEVTVEALNEANELTGGYDIFYPGLEIMVPCDGVDVTGTAVDETAVVSLGD